MWRSGGVEISDMDTSRAEFYPEASAADFRKLAQRRGIKVLQCSEPIPESLWKTVNQHFSRVRPEVEVRVYGYYSGKCKLGFARHLTHVRRFAAEDLITASEVDAIATLSNLESLSIGIFNLKDFSVLERLSANLKSLSLGMTRSKKPSLASLSKFRSLRSLYIEGHNKDIEVLSELTQLRELTLRSVTTRDLSYLAPLQKLRFLAIKLGGIRNFTGIERKECIKYLELYLIRELRNVDIVADLPALQFLFFQSLPHIKSFPPLRGCKDLRRVVLSDLKGLIDFSAFKTAPALEEFEVGLLHKQSPQQLLPVLRNSKVRRVCAYFSSEQKYREFVRLRERYGKDDFSRWSRFKMGRKAK